MIYEAVIGLEIHAQLQTRSKIFCPVALAHEEHENMGVGPVSAGWPGTLPVLNRRAVELAVRAGLALNCAIRLHSQFARKNYFYPDLPKGYQISQWEHPLCGEGSLTLEEDGKSKSFRIQRIHLEEDAGKSVHMGRWSLVNLNRAGIPLIEIVTHPDFRNSREVVGFLKKLHEFLVHLEICDGNLEKGNFRCDVNISVRQRGEKKLGIRTELKNMNSFRFIEKAVEYEIARQISLVSAGGIIVQETRAWDAAANKTISLRSKEDAHDYRYFPDPDLPPLVITSEDVEKVRADMPELPEMKRRRFSEKYRLSEYDVSVLFSEREMTQFFEDCVAAGAPSKMAASWIQTEVLRKWKERPECSLRDCGISPERLAELLQMIATGDISGKIAKKLFEEMFSSPNSPRVIAEERGWSVISDEATLLAWIDEAFQLNASSVEELRGGKTAVLEYLVGQVMRLSRGQAHPLRVSELIRKKANVE